MIILLGFALVYLKKVVEPHVLRMDALAAAAASAYFAGTGGQGAALGQPNQLASAGRRAS